MKYQKFDDKYVLRLGLHEKVRETLTYFMEQEKIRAGFFYGLGALCQAEIAHYPLSEKRYNTENFVGEYEVLNITGNIAMVDEKPFIHMHITLGKKDYSVFGGHLVEGTVSPTLELCIQPFQGTMTRTMVDELGLKLLDLK